MEAKPLALETQSLNHWTTTEAPCHPLSADTSFAEVKSDWGAETRASISGSPGRDSIRGPWLPPLCVLSLTVSKAPLLGLPSHILATFKHTPRTVVFGLYIPMIGNFPCPLAPQPSRPLSLHLLSPMPTPLALEASSQSCLSCWRVFCSWRFCSSSPRLRSASTLSCFSNSRSRCRPATSWLCCSSCSSLSSSCVRRSS